MKNQSIDAILFDFMGVLLFQKENYKSDLVVDEVDQLIGQVICDDKFKNDVIKKYELSNKDFDEIIIKIVNKYEKFEKIWSMLPDLRKNYKLAIINNGTALTLPFLLDKLNIKNLFDAFVSSAIEGIKKPDFKIYLLTAKKLGVDPKRCLFMDDSFKNIEGAKGVGMKTIWWENREKGLDLFMKFISNF